MLASLVQILTGIIPGCSRVLWLLGPSSQADLTQALGHHHDPVPPLCIAGSWFISSHQFKVWSLLSLKKIREIVRSSERSLRMEG